MIRRQRGQADHTGATYAGKQIHGQRELRLAKHGLLGDVSSRRYGQNEHKLDFSWGYKLHFYKDVRPEKVRFKYKDRESSFRLQEIIKYQFYKCSEIDSI